MSYHPGYVNTPQALENPDEYFAIFNFAYLIKVNFPCNLHSPFIVRTDIHV